MITDYQIPPYCNAESVQPPLSSFVNTAVVRRAGAVALILGSILTLVNQTDALIGENRLQVLPLATAYVMPFVDAAMSQVLGVRQARREICQRHEAKFSQDIFFRTALSHGIPARALLLALTIGAANTMIFVGTALSGGGPFSAAPIGQGFILPMLFGLMSQAVAYRRVINGFTPLPN